MEIASQMTRDVGEVEDEGSLATWPDLWREGDPEKLKLPNANRPGLALWFP